jgi:hypothetical protein
MVINFAASLVQQRIGQIDCASLGQGQCSTSSRKRSTASGIFLFDQRVAQIAACFEEIVCDRSRHVGVDRPINSPCILYAKSKIVAGEVVESKSVAFWKQSAASLRLPC